MAESTWSDYYDANEGRAPRDQLLDVLGRFAGPGTAVDVGCGSGIDTTAMLDSGWTVLAIDAEPSAIDRPRVRARPPRADRSPPRPRRPAPRSQGPAVTDGRRRPAAR